MDAAQKNKIKTIATNAIIVFAVVLAANWSYEQIKVWQSKPKTT